jgi:endonuclease/exonuclease/phosphatase family metal-dependent hydrolase
MQLQSLVSVGVVLQASLVAASGSLVPAFSAAAKPLTFGYETTTPHDTNWVAVYAKGKSPSDDSTKYKYDAWNYAKGSSGTTFVDPSKLNSGDYEAWYLAQNKYDVVDGPVRVNINDKSYLAIPNQNDEVTFGYATNDPAATNWIAVYAPGKSPTNDQKSYTTYWYAPNASGTIRSADIDLTAGTYNAYLLAKNGYDILAGPVPFTTTGEVNATLEVDESKPPFVFKYTTNVPHQRNWVGIYPEGSVPENDATKFQYAAWSYAGGRSGSVKVSVNGLEPGVYYAYFLAKNGYTSLTPALKLVYKGDTGPVSFIVTDLTTQNARKGTPFEASVGGLINPRLEVPVFTRVAEGSVNDDWLTVSDKGIITGSPTSGKAGNTTVVVQAKIADGSTSTIAVHIPIVNKCKPMVTEFKLLTFNLWVGGTQVNDYFVKQIRYLVETNADIIAFQETVKGRAAHRLAKAFGWYIHSAGDNSIVSRYPINETFKTSHTSGARVAFDGDKSQVIVWGVHLGYTPYGPYDFCRSKMTKAQVIQREYDSGRTPQVIDVVEQMKPHIATSKNVPVFVVGDFNAPSHLDWTEATASVHCGVGAFDWPTSIIPVEAGLTDSYREIYPDPVKNPAFTWSPVYSASEPMDRIDIMYHAGGVEVLSSEPTKRATPGKIPNQAENEWTSDHVAFFSTYKLLPEALGLHQRA